MSIKTNSDGLIRLQDYSESDLTNSLCAGLRKSGVMCESIVQGASRVNGNQLASLNRRGRPDRWFASRFWDGWIEFKKADGKVSDDQKFWHWEATRRAPGCVLVCRWYQDAILIQYPIANNELNNILYCNFQSQFHYNLFDNSKWCKEAADCFMENLQCASDACEGVNKEIRIER